MQLRVAISKPQLRRDGEGWEKPPQLRSLIYAAQSVNRPHDRAPRERASSGRISIFKIKSDHTVYSRLCTVGDGHI